MNSKNILGKLVDAMIALALGAVALALFLATKAGYSFPSADGTGGARLEVLWRGLDTASERTFPLTETLAGMFGAGNAAATVFGALSTILLFALTARFIRQCFKESERSKAQVAFLSRLGGAVAAVVFMFTPAVHEAATHLEPRLFAAFWAMLVALVIYAHDLLPRKVALAVPVAAGWMCAAGLCDSALFLAVLPLYVVMLWAVATGGNGKPWTNVATFIVVFLVAFFVRAARVSGDVVGMLRETKTSLAGYVEPEGWLFVLLFAAIPFLVAVVAGRRSMREDGYIAQCLSHAALTFATIIAVATPLSPSAQMSRYGILPVLSCAYAAFTAGYLVAYWLLKSRTVIVLPETRGFSLFAKVSRPVALSMLGVFAIVMIIATAINAFSFDPARGSFADLAAEKALDELGEREWLVTDGTLDDHLLLAAQRREKPLHLVSLVRDKDSAYLQRLADAVRAAKLGGDRNEDLLIWLDTLGVLTFVQHWFEAAPGEVKASAAIWGYPDLAPEIDCVPEFMFFGADPAITVDWPKEWAAFEPVLYAPEGWGSYRLWEEKNPMDRMRLNLRRHMGLIANNYAVALHDKGRVAEAFEMYELVLNKIDSDNVCALINELDLASAGFKDAVAKQRHLQGRIQAIVADSRRRYDPRLLPAYYGYVRNPQMFSTIGLALARSGRSGEALKNLARAMELVDVDKRAAMLNAMASIYADSRDIVRSRGIYEGVLAKDPANHDALMGMMRLALMEGDTAKAIEFLEKANAAAGDDPRADSDRAMLAAMKGDLDTAKDYLRKATDANPADLRNWNFLANIIAQQHDAAKDAKLRTALLKELEDVVLPAMDKQATNPADYYVQTVRALILMRKGEDRRREARDALAAAASSNPSAADAANTTDTILGLDIAMNDTEDAERQAISALRRNAKAPLANYVMGSLALQRGDYVQAEAFLRRSADAPKPVSLALNDLAEVLRRSNRIEEAEKYARRAVETAPGLYVAWDTLGTIILARKGDLAEAEKCANRACELSRDENGNEVDIRMLITLARVQFAKGDTLRAKGTLRKVQSRLDELSPFEKQEFEELRKSGK